MFELTTEELVFLGIAGAVLVAPNAAAKAGGPLVALILGALLLVVALVEVISDHA